MGDDPRATPPAGETRHRKRVLFSATSYRASATRAFPASSLRTQVSMIAWLLLTARASAILRLWSGQRFSRLGLGRLHFFHLSHHAERNSHIVARTPSHKTAGGPVLLQ